MPVHLAAVPQRWTAAQVAELPPSERETLTASRATSQLPEEQSQRVNQHEERHEGRDSNHRAEDEGAKPHNGPPFNGEK
jgi:hypothetical protein